MGSVKVGAGDWVVVCDGAKALILENAGDAKFMSLQVREVHEQDNPATHEQGADEPGRIHQSMAAARSAVAQTDWHDRAEQSFLRSVSKRLQKALEHGETRSLIVIAPPRALGVLRATFDPATRNAVKAEIERDYVKLPIAEIEKRLLG